MSPECLKFAKTRREINLLIHQTLHPDFRGALARAAENVPDYCQSEAHSSDISFSQFSLKEYSVYSMLLLDRFRKLNKITPPIRVEAFLRMKGLWRAELEAFFEYLKK